MKKPLIKRVDDNKSKGKTYSALIRKYNEAIESGFYGEAELVVYAFLEDRLRSFIYYSDLLDNINSNKLNEKAAIINGGVLDMDIKNISSKIQIIQYALKTCSMKADEMTPFEKNLEKRYKSSVKVGEMQKTLKHIDKWCKYRNEVIHALFNKDLGDVRKGYEQHVKEGMKLARCVDDQVKSLKNA